MFISFIVSARRTLDDKGTRYTNQPRKRDAQRHASTMSKGETNPTSPSEWTFPLQTLPTFLLALILRHVHVSDVMAVAHTSAVLHKRILSRRHCWCFQANYERRLHKETKHSATFWAHWRTGLKCTPERIDVRTCVARRHSVASLDRALREGADATVGNNAAIRDAARSGNWRAVQRLLRVPGVSVAWGCDATLTCACNAGSLKTVKYLLRANGVDEALSHIDRPLRAAVAQGHRAIVEMLLNDDRSRVWSPRHLVNHATYHGHVDILQLLFDRLAHGRPHDLFELQKAAFSMAVGHARVGVVHHLLSTAPALGSVDVMRETMALDQACEMGDVIVVDILLRNTEVLSKGNCSRAFYHACERGHLRVVERLLDAGVDATEASNRAIYNAALHGLCDVVKCLLRDPNVLQTVDTIRLHGAARASRRNEMVWLVERHIIEHGFTQRA